MLRRRIDEAIREFRQVGAAVTEFAIAEKLDVKLRRIRQVMAMPISVDLAALPYEDDNPDSLPAYFDGNPERFTARREDLDAPLRNRDFRRFLRIAMEDLPPQLKMVLQLYYFPVSK